MADHRYWRITGIQTEGGQLLEVSELRLYAAGVLADAGATLTCPIAPASGTLSLLTDGSAASAVAWPAASYTTPGFALMWDFGAGGAITVSGVRLGAASSLGSFMHNFSLQYSDDGSYWRVFADVVSVSYPGYYSLTAETAAGLAPTTWDADTAGTGVTVSNDGLTATVPCGAPYKSLRTVFGASAGKHYWENLVINAGAQNAVAMAIATAADSLENFPFSSLFYYGANGLKYLNGVGSAYGPPFTGGVTISYLLDLDDGTLGFWIEGVDLGVAFTGLSGTYYAALAQGSSSGAPAVVASNFGQYPFDYTRPAGYNAGLGTVSLIATDALSPIFRTPAPQPIIYGAQDLGQTTALSPRQERNFFDAYHGGTGIVVGTVAEKNTPANTPLRRRVMLIDERSRIAIRQTWSDAVTGNYEFPGIAAGVPYTVISYDHKHNYRAVIADNKIPEAMA